MTVIPLAREASSATVADDCSEFYARYRRPLVAYVAPERSPLEQLYA